VREELYTEVTERAPATLKRISWGAIFAGAVTVLAIQLALNVLGISIGAAVFEPRQGDSLSGMGLGAGIWLVVSALVALFAGGWVAGRLSGIPNRTDGMLHGFVTWGVATLVFAFLLTTAVGNMIGGAAGILGRTAQAAAPQLTRAVQQQTGMAPAEVSQQAADVLSDQRFQNWIKAVAADRPVQPQERQQVVSLVAEKRGVDQAQAEQLVARWEQSARDARSKLAASGEEAGDSIAKAAGWTFLMLLLGALAGSLGGAAGAPRYPAAPARPSRVAA
jgi:hypothetical protein